MVVVVVVLGIIMAVVVVVEIIIMMVVVLVVEREKLKLWSRTYPVPNLINVSWKLCVWLPLPSWLFTKDIYRQSF